MQKAHTSNAAVKVLVDDYQHTTICQNCSIWNTEYILLPTKQKDHNASKYLQIRYSEEIYFVYKLRISSWRSFCLNKGLDGGVYVYRSCGAAQVQPTGERSSEVGGDRSYFPRSCPCCGWDHCGSRCPSPLPGPPTPA